MKHVAPRDLEERYGIFIAGCKARIDRDQPRLAKLAAGTDEYAKVRKSLHAAKNELAALEAELAGKLAALKEAS